MHIGSPQVWPRVTAILSVMESCRRLKIPVRDYLADTLPGLADAPAHPPHRRTHAHSLGGKDTSLKNFLIPIAQPSTVCLAGRIRPSNLLWSRDLLVCLILID